MPKLNNQANTSTAKTGCTCKTNKYILLQGIIMKIKHVEAVEECGFAFPSLFY
jgi:hypothetical protein